MMQLNGSTTLSIGNKFAVRSPRIGAITSCKLSSLRSIITDMHLMHCVPPPEFEYVVEVVDDNERNRRVLNCAYERVRFRNSAMRLTLSVLVDTSAVENPVFLKHTIQRPWVTDKEENEEEEDASLSNKKKNDDDLN